MAKNCSDKRRSDCPISSVLDLLGDKWTLIIIRDMLFLGKKLYKELAVSKEGIPTNILSERLKRLEASDIVTRKAYQDNPPRYAYELTSKGVDLFPILKELAFWGVKHLKDLPPRGPAFFKNLEKRVKNLKSA